MSKSPSADNKPARRRSAAQTTEPLPGPDADGGFLQPQHDEVPTVTQLDTVLEQCRHHQDKIGESFSKFNEKLDDLKTVLIAHTTEAEGRKKAIENLEHTVYGNGSEGLKIRMDRLEQWQKVLRWSMTGVVVPLLVYAGYTLLQKWILHTGHP